MPYILMPNQTKVFVQEVGYFQNEMPYATVLADLNGFHNDMPRKIIAARLLGALGVLASDAIPYLEHIIYSVNDPNLVSQCVGSLERIDVKYRGIAGAAIRARLDAVKQGTNVVQTVEPAKKKTMQVDIIQAECVELDKEVKVSRKCNFCEKETIAQPEVQRLTEKLCQPNKFYCSFCLRNNLQMKDNKHTLMLTFRAIFGYYFYEFYQTPKQPLMYLSEIQDCINLHRDIGLLNPVFNYDPESYVWFVDFGRVGSSKKKISVEDVKQTVTDILASFNLATTITGLDMPKLFQKYNEAIDDFYTKRYRPEGKRLLAPTLKNCGNIQWGGVQPAHWQVVQQVPQKMSLEDTKGFLPHLIEPQKYWRKTATS